MKPYGFCWYLCYFQHALLLKVWLNVCLLFIFIVHITILTSYQTYTQYFKKVRTHSSFFTYYVFLECKSACDTGLSTCGMIEYNVYTSNSSNIILTEPTMTSISLFINTTLFSGACYSLSFLRGFLFVLFTFFPLTKHTLIICITQIWIGQSRYHVHQWGWKKMCCLSHCFYVQCFVSFIINDDFNYYYCWLWWWWGLMRSYTSFLWP